MGVLPIEGVRLSLTAGSKGDAILATGRILEELQAVAPGYADAMLEREQIISTSVGEGFAIPHGTDESRVLIRRTALSFAQFPAGVDWETDRVFVCIGIAARDDAHLGILGRLADILIQPDLARQLREATDPAVVMSVLGPALEEEASTEATHEDGTAARAG
jgi:mannitol/fructose-specific phosphotransferase system IIA component